MIYKIKFLLRNIKTGSDPWELHFWVENEDKEIIERLKKDFTFRLDSDWIVSANKTTWDKEYWFIRGSREHVDGKKKYYNVDSEISYFKEYFNKELVKKYPQISNNEHTGEFDMERGVMSINKY